MTVQDLWSWVWAHDWQIICVISYVLLNVGPRPHPENLTGWRRTFWLVVDRLAVLSAERVPGNWKMFLASSPPPMREATLTTGERVSVRPATGAAPAGLVAVPAPKPSDPDPPPAPPEPEEPPKQAS